MRIDECTFEYVYRIVSIQFKSLFIPQQEVKLNMNIRVEKACGIDVHQAFLAATILTSMGNKDTREFSSWGQGVENPPAFKQGMNRTP